MFSLICVWINGCVHNREVGDLRRHHAHHDVIVMCYRLASVPGRGRKYFGTSSATFKLLVNDLRRLNTTWIKPSPLGPLYVGLFGPSNSAWELCLCQLIITWIYVAGSETPSRTWKRYPHYWSLVDFSRRCSNYIFILDLTSGFKGFGKDSHKTVWEFFKCWDLVRLILETWWYFFMGVSTWNNRASE